MSKQTLAGTALETLDYHLVEFFGPGEQVEVTLGLECDITDEQILAVSTHLVGMGLDLKRIQAGSTPEWPHAVQMVFRRPLRSPGLALIPIAQVVKQSFTSAGIGKCTGWNMQ